MILVSKVCARWIARWTLAASLVAIHGPRLRGSDFDWNGPVNGSARWDVAENWLPTDGPPDAASLAFFRLPEPVIVAGGGTARLIAVERGDVTFKGTYTTDMESPASAFLIGGPEGATTRVSAGGSLAVGRRLDIGRNVAGAHGDGTLLVAEEGSVRVHSNSGTPSVNLGFGSGSTGTINIGGPGAEFITEGTLNVAFAAGSVGQINVLDGGLLETDGNVVLASTDDSIASVAVAGNDSTWDLHANLRVGNRGSAVLTIREGGHVEVQGETRVGNLEGSVSSITVSGSAEQGPETISSRFEHHGPLHVGVLGQGILQVLEGGQLLSAAGTNGVISLGHLSGGHGELAIRGPGSLFSSNGLIEIGRLGTGELWLADGGLLDARDGLAIGSGVASSGMATVRDGAEIRFQGTLKLGDRGTGELSVTGGQVMHNTGNGELTIATGNGGEGRLALRNGAMLHVEKFRAGSQGPAEVTFDGAQVFTSDVFLGAEEGASSTAGADVEVHDSTWTIAGNLQIGRGGNLRIRGESAAPAVQTGSAHVAGTLELSEGGSASVEQELRLADGGTIDVNQGRLRVGPSAGGSSPPLGSLQILSGGTLHGPLEGVASLAGQVINEGHVSLATPGGELDLEGNLLQGENGRLRIEIGGSSREMDSPLLNVEGDVFLSGAFDVRLSEGFIPHVGEIFHVLTADSLAGSFDNLSLFPGLGIDLAAFLRDGSVVVTRVPDYWPGDATQDDHVDLADFTVLKEHFGQSPATFSQGDFDGNNAVDLSDFALLKAAFGVEVVRSPVPAVPEPATWSLALCVAAWMMMQRGRFA